MLKKITRIIPQYAIIPLLTCMLFNFTAYYVPKLIIDPSRYNGLAIPGIDSEIPFVPFFVFPYAIAFAQWVIGFIVIAREGKKRCLMLVATDVIAKLTCMAVFIIYPTAIELPEVTGSSLSELVVRTVYFFDTPTNLFPSIHCLESWICVRMTLPLRRVPEWYKHLMFVLSAFVFASVVLIKQHYAIDILAGILVFEAAYFVVKKTRVHRLGARIFPFFD